VRQHTVSPWLGAGEQVWDQPPFGHSLMAVQPNGPKET
jgi:hypothetical protein